LKRITKLFIKQKNFNHGIQPWVRNLHMEILMLITIKPRAQRLLSNGIPLLIMMTLILPNDMVRMASTFITTQLKESLPVLVETKQRLPQRLINT
jgi:hypothetical protein